MVVLFWTASTIGIYKNRFKFFIFKIEWKNKWNPTHTHATKNQYCRCKCDPNIIAMRNIFVLLKLVFHFNWFCFSLNSLVHWFIWVISLLSCSNDLIFIFWHSNNYTTGGYFQEQRFMLLLCKLIISENLHIQINMQITTKWSGSWQIICIWINFRTLLLSAGFITKQYHFFSLHYIRQIHLHYDFIYHRF